ncbi:uncharacterized protein LOC131853024 [Achroia grisella]|uniref:uncharacterized protein LOC131853024 n=1 Tax=Achroia grisella TaxID=688607 RepID=UPI0027D272E6|nr:uncharacterized protein LOC131853024 [Achroia grisella]
MDDDDKQSVPPVSTPRKLLKELAELKKQRGYLKGRLTQFRKYLDSFQVSSPSKHEIKEIQFRMKATMDLYKNFNNIETQIEFLIPESEAVNNSEYVESFEALYFDIMATSEGLIECNETGGNTNKPKFNNISSDEVPEVKLSCFPDIKLPSFDGLSFDAWLAYKDSFVTMIHEHSELNDIQKFYYLKSSLRNSALQVISELEFTSNNYKHAWDLLQSKYHNPSLLVNNHLKSLFSIPSMKQESHTEIRELIDTVLWNLRALNSLDEPTDSWDTIIIYLIVTKLDTATERDWKKHKGTLLCEYSRKLKLDDLLSFLHNKADKLDMITSSHSKV